MQISQKVAKSKTKKNRFSTLTKNFISFRLQHYSFLTLKFLRSNMSPGALIMTHRRPLLRATYEVIILYPVSIQWQHKCRPLVGIESGTSRSK